MPGELPWLASPAASVENLAATFYQQCRGRAAIVGPHGSGKSTLLAHLVPRLGGVGWYQSAENLPSRSRLTAHGRVVWHVVHRRWRPFQQIVSSRQAWKTGGVLCVDGWEQLRHWEAAWIRRWLWKTRMGLLVTCHRRRLTLATLHHTAPDLSTVQRLVVERLAHAAGISDIVRQQLSDGRLVERLLKEEQGSVREVFMRLYDLVENYYRSSEMFAVRMGSATRINDLVHDRG